MYTCTLALVVIAYKNQPTTPDAKTSPNGFDTTVRKLGFLPRSLETICQATNQQKIKLRVLGVFGVWVRETYF